MNTYFSVKEYLEESGWKLQSESWYPNSEHNHWIPANSTTEDIYLFEGYHRNGLGRDLQVVWADSYEEAYTLSDSGNGNPSFSVKSFEDFQAIIRSLL